MNIVLSANNANFIHDFLRFVEFAEFLSIRDMKNLHDRTLIASLTFRRTCFSGKEVN